MEYKDYHQILGVSKNAEKDEIKRAYRRLAQKYHPDLNKASDAEEKFKEVKEAYEMLTDPEKRQAYEQTAHASHDQTEGFDQQNQSNSNFSDFFSDLFGNARQQSEFNWQQSYENKSAPGANLHSKLTITLEEAFQGGVRDVSLQNRDKALRVKIPQGILPGQQIRLEGQGRPGINGGPAGDLYFEILILEHPLFSLKDRNILLNLPVTPWEVALGTTLEIPTLAGKVELKIPAGSQTGQKLRLKGRGLPGKIPGDQYVTLQIITPPADNADKRVLYEKMAQTMAFNPRQHWENVR